MALATVSSDRRHLVHPKGNPFFVLGVNYTGYFDRAWQMWETGRFDPDLITRDFRKAQLGGFNVIRLFAHRELLNDIRQDNFAKLDQTLSLAQDHNLLVILTLNDSHYLNLEQVAELDTRIASRYNEVPTLLAYDLEHEPAFYNLAAAIYPPGYEVPLQTSQLIDQYGVRVSREEAADLKRSRQIPGHLDDEQAFYYINALRLFIEYDQAIKNFARQGRGTLVDFLYAAESEPWHLLVGLLDSTVEAWLRARIDPIRAAGCRHLLTVGWNWLHFAALPANGLLDFQSYHNYGDISFQSFNTNVAHLEALHHTFPKHPLLLAEFGWTNQSSTNPANSRALHPTLTGLYEAATFCYLRANGFSGGIKWQLNDLQDLSNPYEANFGVFESGDKAKPIRDLVQQFSQDWPTVDRPANFTLLRDAATGMSYRFNLPEQVTVGGYIYQDEVISWRAQGVSHCFITRADQELVLESVGAGQLSLDPWDLISTWDQARETNLFRLYGDGRRTRQHTFEPGQSVVVDLQPGAQYVITIGAKVSVTTTPDDAPQIEPQAGEHVLLLADFEQYMPAALNYVGRFAPDFTFMPDQVAGRWPYVSVVATPDQVAETTLETIRSSGALLVERVVGNTPEATKTLLDELADRGQRFLTTLPPAPPQEEPPPDPGEAPPPDGAVGETYLVQPGDTLGKIATLVYGDFRLWPLIFEANRDKIADPGLIRVGMELRIPERE